MAFVVENGTGLSNSNSYISVADADSYFTDRNKTDWISKSEAEKKAALIEATRFIDGNYLWTGHIKYNDQSLGWPRILVCDDEGRNIDSDTIPERVKFATCELAYEALTKSLSPALPRGGEIKRRKVSSLEVEYFSNSSPDKVFPIANQLLKGFYKNSPTVKLTR